MAIAARKETGIPESLQVAESDNYLGSADNVTIILRQFLDRCYARVNPFSEQFMPKEQAAAAQQADAIDMATIFLGRNPKYPGIKWWNKEGGIDQWVKQKLNIEESDPQLIMSTAFLDLILELYKIVNYSQQEGVLPEHWTWQIDALVETYAKLFLGIEPVEE